MVLCSQPVPPLPALSPTKTHYSTTPRRSTGSLARKFEAWCRAARGAVALDDAAAIRDDMRGV